MLVAKSPAPATSTRANATSEASRIRGRILHLYHELLAIHYVLDVQFGAIQESFALEDDLEEH